MGRFRLDSIADLSRQMSFTPADTRLTQLASAEELLHDLEPTRGYPLEFIVFRITGYHPKTLDGDLLTGVALQHDLGLLIEKVSDGLELKSSGPTEPVLDLADVCERFNVTSKTIQRWRRRGLPARRFWFPDGKKRVGFLLSSVEHFFATHRDQVARATNFSQVTESEKEQIVRRARRLAGNCQCCVHEITRRIGRRVNRSPITILHVLRKHDQENPADPVFANAPAPLSEQDRVSIVKRHRRGVSVKVLARRMCRPASTIYRAILEERIAKLARRKIKFIDDPLYHQPDAGGVIDAILRQEELDVPSGAEDARIPKDLPAYLADLYRVPLLSKSKEAALFLLYNFRRYQFAAARRRLEPQFARRRDLDLLEGHLKKATEVKNRILRANLRLVVSIARKHLRPGLSLMELISDGNLTLMRAVESFDTHKGNRFSTYATLALMKGFARSVPAMQVARNRTRTLDVLRLDPHDLRGSAETQRAIDREQVGQLMSRLDDRERHVLRAHYGLADDTTPATYEQVGVELGLSKQRVRQIEREALGKLRMMVGAGG